MVVARNSFPTRVVLDELGVLITEMHEGDPRLVAFVAEADDPEEAVRRCLRVGADVQRGAQTFAEAELLRDFERRLDERIGEAERATEEVTTRLLDPDTGAARQLIGIFEKTLAETLDPEHKASAISKFEKLIADGIAQQAKVVRDLVDPGNPESPMGRFRDEEAKDFKEVLERLERIETQQAVVRAEAVVLDMSAVKGRRFEELVDGAVGAIVTQVGDRLEFVGSSNGSTGARVGDFTVVLDPATILQGEGRYVVEAKDRKLSMRQAMSELDRAMENRDATAGVIVFARQEQAPTPLPFQMFGDKAVVVYDKELLDDQALRVALVFARAMVQRHAGNGDGAMVDVDALLVLFDKAMQALAHKSDIRACLTRVKKEAEGAGGHLDRLITDVDDLLQEARRLLSG